MLNNEINITVGKNYNFLKAVGIQNINVFSNFNSKKVLCQIKNVANIRKNVLSQLETAGTKIFLKKLPSKIKIKLILLTLINKIN